MEWLWSQLTNLYWNISYRPDWRDIIDIIVVAALIYQLINLANKTRGSSVLRGIIAIIAVVWLSTLLNLRALNWIIARLLNNGLIILVVIFQPELRRGLQQVGQRMLLSRDSASVEENKRIVGEITNVLTRLSRRKVGALIVFEGNTGLADIIESGTVLNARISAGLIENIFEPNTPLHDGAVIINGHNIYAAACILPLTQNTNLSSELVTRHRAALGVSESTDAKVLVVSEETGIISMAYNGQLNRYLDNKSLQDVLKGIYKTEKKPGFMSRLFKRGAAK